ncbi:TnsA-like heteromeric transposase endonuclease subunit [Streptomyces sp. NPDC005181]|uniref:TnsA-like heteromeric transposase endonuclease subunit n=1 Tax=Streptomyces sp. NPDC005181 TaxID=3156869 RepID=UPI0033BE1F91
MRLGPLARCWGESFEFSSPARKFTAFKGQRNFTGGTGVVVDVRPQSLVDEEAAEVCAVTARICATAARQFRLVGDLDQPFRANLRRLARYHHPRCHRTSVANQLREVFTEPQLLLAGTERIGDRLAVLPVFYHLLWQHELTADLLAAPLGAATVVRLAVRVVQVDEAQVGDGAQAGLHADRR